MQRTVVSIKLTNSQMRDAAMRESGLSPQVMSILPGTRVQRDRKVALKRGYQKHKGRGWD